MRHHDDPSATEGPEGSAGADAVETFLAQPPLVETPDVDEAAAEREGTLHPGPDTASIAEAIEFLQNRHSSE
jgi:hypothetical protein